MNGNRIYLSPPNVDAADKAAVNEALDSGWVAPVGPAIDRFEQRLSRFYPGKKVLCVNSGTSALHLALLLAGVEKEDHVVLCSLNFAACANAILYQNGNPVFIDSEEHTWNLDADLLEEYLCKVSKKPKAIIVTHIYGMPAKVDRIASLANQYEITLIEDAAEALGSKHKGIDVGGAADYGILSFNGNKLVTTSGGGALILPETHYQAALHLATQANAGINEYHHDRVGYNYRMSNVLAALGDSQLSKLDKLVAKKRSIYHAYKDALSDHIHFLDEPEGLFSNRWLSTGLMKEKNPLQLLSYLEKHSIEGRRLWKPLHLHPAYDRFQFVGSGLCEKLFARGICLPSGTGLVAEDQEYVINKVKRFFTQ
ncbi:MAG: DegT/DnrJ/EryC1/StrS family aminotransferase [Ekhidna sp.]